MERVCHTLHILYISDVLVFVAKAYRYSENAKNKSFSWLNQKKVVPLHRFLRNR